MQGTGNPEPKKVNKLLSSSHNRAALTNERSNFITETRTVVVHKAQTVVLDSPERASRNRGGVTTAGGMSLASIGLRHMQKQKERQAAASQPALPANPTERKTSQFLSTSSSSTSSTGKSFGIGALGATSFSAGALSKNNNTSSSQQKAPLVPTGAANATGGMTLSDKFRARLQQKQQQSVTASVNSSTSSLSQLQRSLSSNNNSAGGGGGGGGGGGVTAQSAPRTLPTTSAVTTSNLTCDNDTRANYTTVVARTSSTYGASSTNTTAQDTITPSATTTNNTVPGGLLLGTNRTMAVKSVVAAPVKSVKFTSTTSTHTTTSTIHTGTDGSGVDAAMFGAHNVGAAESVGTYLDTIMPSNTSGVKVSSGGSGGGRNGKSTSGGSAGSTSKVKKDSTGDGESAEGDDGKQEKADAYSNFVRKNLKSGGTSKKLNRTTSRTSMAKQRWINRQGESSGGSGGVVGVVGGGKYGKYSKYKKGSYSGGGSGGGDDSNNGGGGGSSYNKPRGLQQWGLDALEMSLNLLEGGSGEGSEGSGNVDGTTSSVVQSSGIDLYDSGEEDGDGGGSDVSGNGSGSDMEVELCVRPAKPVVPITHNAPAVPSATASSGASTNTIGAKAAVQPNQRTAPTNTTTTTPYTTTSTTSTTSTTTPRTTTASARPKLSKQAIAANKAQARAEKRQLENTRVNSMAQCAPRCPGHSMPSKLLVVKKSGANKGKYFYSCTFPSEQRCNFFMWAEDNPELLDKTAAQHKTRPRITNTTHINCTNTSHNTSNTTNTTTTTDPALLLAQAKLDYELTHYAAKLKTFNSAELKAEVLKISHRLRLAGCAAKMSTAGTKEELIERLVDEAVRILTGTIDTSGGGGGGGGGSGTSGSGGGGSGSAKVKKVTTANKRAKNSAVVDSDSGSDGSDSDGESDVNVEKKNTRSKRVVRTKPPATTNTAISSTSKDSVIGDNMDVDTAADVVVDADVPVVAVEEGRRTSTRIRNTTNTSHPTNTTNTTSTKTATDTANSADSAASGDENNESGSGSESDNIYDTSSDADNTNTYNNNEEVCSDSESILLDAAVEVNVGSTGADDSSGSESEGSVVSSDNDSIGGSESEQELNTYANDYNTDSSNEHTTYTTRTTRTKPAKRPVSKKAKVSSEVSKAHSMTGKTDDEDGESVGEMELSTDVHHLHEYDALESLLRVRFGFTSFRPGQRWAMQRCLQGQSSLLVMPTGAGKSLCYMLPALALPGLTVVVSPLVALMQDQLRKLPLGLTGACLSGSLTAQEMMQISEAVLQGHIKVLYVSPERLCTPSFRRLITLLKQQQHFRRMQSRQSRMYNSNGAAPDSYDQPVVSLLCVDEAHCLSQWSYNFRPAFLRIRREVQFIQPAAVLALTATATPRIQHDVMRHLGIPLGEGLMALPVRRDNLQVTVHMVEDEEQRRGLIVELVKEPRIVVCNSSNTSSSSASGSTTTDAAVGSKRAHSTLTTTNTNTTTKNKPAVPPLTIVYVWRRFEADALSEFLKASGVPGVAVYHAGIDAGTRARTQLMFDRGKVRCIVATVAFGMGVDKSDVRQVIHCTLPKSIESYMQEMGRAGRDGQPAACHLLLQQSDAVLQHSLSHSMQLSHIQIASLLLRVFLLNSGSAASGSTTNTATTTTSASSNTMHKYLSQALKSDVSLLLDPLEASMDINSTVVETIMSVLELPPYNLLIVDGTHFDVIKGRFRTTSDNLSSDVLVQALLALNTIKPSEDVLHKDFKPNQSNGMSDSYGMGYDCSASAANQGFTADDDVYNSNTTTSNTTNTANTNSSSWERDRQRGNYGGKIIDFECSRLAVALHTSLTVEEVSTGLYKLQRSGVLEYKLQDSALYLKVLPYTLHTNGTGGSSYSSDRCSTDFHFNAYCAQHKHTTNTTTTSASAKDKYFDWIWHLSCSVYTSLYRIAAGGSHRITDMWRTGATIAHYTSASSGTTGSNSGSSIGRGSNGVGSRGRGGTSGAIVPVDPAHAVAVHSAAQSLLSYVMSDADGSNTTTSSPATTNDTTNTLSAGADSETNNHTMTDDSGDDDLYVQMKNLYLSTPPPFTSIVNTTSTNTTTTNATNTTDAKATAAVNKLRDKLRTDVHVLQRDPNLLTAVNTLLKQAVTLLAHQAAVDRRNDAHSTTPTSTTSTTNTTGSDVTVQHAKKGLLALCMCRIMHALPTKLLPATAWRDRSDAWGSHKDVEFDQLLEFIVQELR